MVVSGSLNNIKSIDELELKLLIETIYQRYGYDFRNYKEATLKNKFEKIRKEKNLNSISELIPKVIHDRQFFEALFLELSISVTEMFRDPYVFKAIKKDVIPQLKTYPFINVWHAGCSTGEEVFSMAVLLKEENILHRSQLYGTDINDNSLSVAIKGIYPMHEMKKHMLNYKKVSGQDSLSDYFYAKYKGAKMNKEIRDQITFSKHNLVTDWVFAETQLIFCRNVLIYFNQKLKNRVLELFAASLCKHGFLCLGTHESILGSSVSEKFEKVDSHSNIYRKI